MPGLQNLSIWPRKEVFELVIPPLATIGGKNLSYNTCIQVIRKLIKVQSPEGKISYDRWLVVAKDALKWNDHCIQLFWEMLTCAMYYVTTVPDETSICLDESAVDLEYISIFLVLHVSENQTRPNSPIIAYGTVWPSAHPDGESTSPYSSPVSSPTGGKQLIRNAPTSPTNSRSPHRKTAAAPMERAPSPSKRSQSLSHQPKSSAQYLHSVAQKIPIVLKALCADPETDLGLDSRSTDSFHKSADMNQNPRAMSRSITISEPFDRSPIVPEFDVTRKTIDALGLIICGGTSRDQHVTAISSLFPKWQSQNGQPDSRTADGMVESTETPIGKLGSLGMKDTSASSTVLFSEISQWIDSHLSLNDTLYPVVSANYSSSSNLALSGSPSGSPKGNMPGTQSTAAHGVGGGVGVASKTGGAHAHTPSHGHAHALAQSEDTHIKHGHGSVEESSPYEASSLNPLPRQQQPSRHIIPLSALTRFAPTVVSYSCKTIINLATSGPVRSGSRKKYEDKSQEKTGGSTPVGTPADAGPESVENASPSSDTALALESDVESESTSERSKMVEDGSRPDGSEVVDPGTMTGADGEAETRMSVSRSMEKLMLEGEEEGEGGGESSSQQSVLKGGRPTLGSTNPAITLPQLYLNFCYKSSIYMISPYYSASVTGCSDCTIVMGAVYGAVVVSGCERVKLTVACRKLIVLNCLECDFSIATLSVTVINGDSRSLTIGPYNTAYRDLKQHLKMAGLQALIASPPVPLSRLSSKDAEEGDVEMDTDPLGAATNEQSEDADTSTSKRGGGKRVEGGLMPPATPQPSVISTGVSANCWSVLCDVNATLEAAANTSSPSGYALDARSGSSMSLLPSPPSSTASVRPFDAFRLMTLPFKPEHISFDLCPIQIQSGYIDSAREQQDGVLKVKNQIASIVESNSNRDTNNKSSSNGVATSEGESGTSAEVSPSPALLATSLVSRKFLAWLASSDHMHEVLDLIRIDNEIDSN